MSRILITAVLFLPTAFSAEDNITTGKRPCEGLLIETYNHAEATFTPSGERVAVAWQGVVQLLDCATGRLLGPPLTLGGNGWGKPAFNSDERLLVLPYGRARVWRVPPPAEDAPGRLQLSVEVRTGLRVDENGALQKLSHQEWLDRKKLLKKLGGLCDVPANLQKPTDQ